MPGIVAPRPMLFWDGENLTTTWNNSVVGQAYTKLQTWAKIVLFAGLGLLAYFLLKKILKKRGK